MVGLRSQNPSLQLIAAVGGYNEPLVPVWSAMAANAGTRNNFAQNCLSFIQRNNLNGIGELRTVSNYNHGTFTLSK